MLKIFLGNQHHKLRQFFLTLAAITVLTSFFVAPLVVAQESSDEPLSSAEVYFSDVVGHWAEPFIEEIVILGIANGYEDGRFGTDDEITRAQMAKMAYLAFVGKNKPNAPEQVFKDVPKDHWAAGYIWELKDKGVVTGYGDGTNYGPEDTLTRDQGVKLLLAAANITPQENLSNDFSDVEEYWATPWINTAVSLNVVSGYKDSNLFGPIDPLLRSQVAKMISILLSQL